MSLRKIGLAVAITTITILSTASMESSASASASASISTSTSASAYYSGKHHAHRRYYRPWRKQCFHRFDGVRCFYTR